MLTFFFTTIYMEKEYKIAVIGLGYVGLPLATLFASKFPVVGYDINEKRIHSLLKGIDYTQEVSISQIKDVVTNESSLNNGFLIFSSSIFLTRLKAYS